MEFPEFPEFFDIFSWKLLLLIVIICVIRAWLKGAQFKGQERVKGGVAVVTGATAGIGKQLARELNYRGAKVYALYRTQEHGDAALNHLIQMGCHSERIIMKKCDMASFESIRNCVEEIRDNEEKVDILVCNAAIMLYPKFQLTPDGHELTWQTNYLGHFLLTQELLPLLEKSPSGGRVVNVSAVAHNYADGLDLASIDRREYFDTRQAYARSKLAQVMVTKELSRRLRLRGSPVTVNSCHPGLCYTRLIRHTPLAKNGILKVTLGPLAWFFLKSPKDGAQTPLFLALADRVNGVSGRYFAELHEKDACEFAEDEERCKELYEYSSRACR